MHLLCVVRTLLLMRAMCTLRRLLPLHFLTFIVLLVCVAESAAAFAGYLEQNRIGQPQCCPFPRIVVASMVLELLRRGRDARVAVGRSHWDMASCDRDCEGRRSAALSC